MFITTSLWYICIYFFFIKTVLQWSWKKTKSAEAVDQIPKTHVFQALHVVFNTVFWIPPHAQTKGNFLFLGKLSQGHRRHKAE